MTCPFGEADLVGDIVFTRGLDHRNTLHLPEGLGVVNHKGALHVPNADGGVGARLIELDMGRSFAWLGLQRPDDLELVFVDDMHQVLLLTQEGIDPRIGRILMASQKKAWPFGGDAPDYRPIAHIDDRDEALLEVGHSEDSAALIYPGNPRAKMRHAAHGDLRNRLAGREVDDRRSAMIRAGSGMRDRKRNRRAVPQSPSAAPERGPAAPRAPRPCPAHGCGRTLAPRASH